MCDDIVLKYSLVIGISVVSMGFFFFKQKTAYEMRISDWSSDVCSSDLKVRHAIRTGSAQGSTQHRIRNHGSAWIGVPQSVDPAYRAETREIGRASCRERVCQYV